MSGPATPARHLAVSCDRCGAASGEPCINWRTGKPLTAFSAHETRRRKAAR
ncbi:zinc finger domain-containing protein [Actinoplanes teichomyceticus]|uniref:DNA-binding phage zinc finger domain-containing protein n=1 Tax=Actinoplanes teichomyceticus TaxID=1867 RepID=A0A561WSA2_ACTTI|nr:hypothetical protein FHX34_1011745 [Actinoplanes teichomyceticus]